MDPFALVASAVAEHLLGGGLKRLKRTWRWRLAHEVARGSGSAISAKRLRKVLKRRDVFQLLATGTSPSGDSLRTRIEEAVRAEHPQWDGRDVAESASRVTYSLLARVLRLLDPQDAIAIASERQIDSARRIEERQERVEELLESNTLVETEVARLPPLADASIRALSDFDREGAARLIRYLTLEPGGAAAACVGLIASAPAWISSLSPYSWLTLGEIAAGYSRAESAQAAFERAVQDGATSPDRWLLRAAHMALARGDRAGAEALGERAKSSGPATLAVFIESLIAEDNDALIAAGNAIAGSNDPDEATVLTALARAYFAKGELETALRTCGQVITQHPRLSGALLVKSQILLYRVQEGASPTRHVDWSAAVDSALACRDLRRQWQGPSEEAVEVICKAAVLEHDWAMVLRYGLEPPRGEATELEAAHQPVLRIVLAAATVSGDVELSEELISRISDEHERQFQRGLLLEHLRTNREKIVEAYEAAAGASRNADELGNALLGLASVGVWPLHRLGEVEAANPEMAAIVTAMAAIERGEHELAVDALKPFATKSLKALDLLSRAHDASGATDRAIELLRQGYQRYQSIDLLVRIVTLLIRDGRQQDAEAELRDAISVAPSGTHHMLELRRYGLQLAADRGDWQSVADRGRAILVDSGPDPDTVWAVVFAEWNLVHLDRARQVLDQYDDVLPRNADEAQAWLMLKRRSKPSDKLVLSVLRVAAQFLQDEEIAGSALIVAYEVSRNESLLAATVDELHRLTNSYVEAFPDSEVFRVVHFSTPEEMLAELRQVAGPAARGDLADEIRQVVEAGRPQGILAAASGRSYTEALLRRAAGCLPLSRPAEAQLASERAVAAAAAGQRLVLDLSVLSSFSLVPSLWSKFVSAFDRAVLHRAARIDLEQGLSELRLRSTRSIGWEPGHSRPILTEISEADADAIANRAQWMTAVADECEISANESLAEFPTLPLQRFGSWLGGIDLAKRLGLPFCTDDVGLQWLADAMDVAVFSSLSLVQSHSAFSENERRSYVATLARNWAVDLPLTLNDLEELAEESAWVGGPAAGQLTRAAFWADPGAAQETFTALLRGAQRNNPASLPAWTQAALRGVARATRDEAGWTQVGKGVLALATWTSGFESHAFAAFIEGATSIAVEYGRTDLLEATITHLFEIFVSQFGPALAVSESLRLIGELPIEKKHLAMRAVIKT